MTPFQERRKADVCTCGHHMDAHIDSWAACEHGNETVSCLCGEYEGPITRWDHALDGPEPVLALIRKDTSLTQGAA